MARIIGHSKYNSWNIDYDFALLELAEELEFSAEIQPIEIATSAPAPGTPAVVTGWGAVQEGGASASVLQEVRVPIVSIEECRASYGQAKITDRMICAGIQQGGQDACQVSFFLILQKSSIYSRHFFSFLIYIHYILFSIIFIIYTFFSLNIVKLHDIYFFHLG